MRRVVLLGALVATGAMSVAAARVQPAQQVPNARPALEVRRIKANLYLIGTGSAVGQGFIGGNTAVFVTQRGVVVVDTKVAGWGTAMLETIKTVTTQPVTMIINTHTHYDHTGSNAEFPGIIEFVAHENTKAHLSEPTCPTVTNCDAFKGANAKFLPKTIFKDRLSLLSGKDQIDLYYFGPGHTNGDAFVVFRAVQTLHAGDMFPWKDSPFLDRGNGGSGVAIPATLAKAVAGIKNVDTVIGGHQPPATWKDFEEYQRFNQDVLNAAREAMKAGKSVDEAAVSIKVAEKYTGYEAQRLKAALAAIYGELSGQ